MTDKIDLLELDKLYAASKQTGDYISLAIAIDKYWPAISARLEEYEEQLDAIEADALSYEKGCTRALRQIADKLDFEWDGDGATADQLWEHFEIKWGELTAEAEQGTAAEINDAYALELPKRDARMKALGAAEAWDQIARIAEMVTEKAIRVTAPYAEEQAARLRAEARSDGRNIRE